MSFKLSSANMGLLPGDIITRDIENQEWFHSNAEVNIPTQMIMAEVEAVAAGLAIRHTYRDPSWRDKKACSDASIETFILPQGQSPAKARKICADCIVWFECLEFALQFPSTEGIIAGTSPAERRQIRSIRKARLNGSKP